MIALAEVNEREAAALKARAVLARNEKSERSFSQAGEDLIVKFTLQFLGNPSITYLDIGANHPVRLNNTYLFYLMGCKGVLVEPNASLCERLRASTTIFDPGRRNRGHGGTRGRLLHHDQPRVSIRFPKARGRSSGQGFERRDLGQGSYQDAAFEHNDVMGEHLQGAAYLFVSRHRGSRPGDSHEHRLHALPTQSHLHETLLRARRRRGPKSASSWRPKVMSTAEGRL